MNCFFYYIYIQPIGKIGNFVRFSKQGIDVKTAQGTLRLIKIKPEGKGEMFAADWANGLKK